MEIYIVGYPKSGNTWLARLIGDALDSPILDKNGATPLAAEGRERTGGHSIYQLHLEICQAQSCAHNGFINTPPYAVCTRHRAEGEPRFVHIVRDPRDVAISAWQYWERPSIEATLNEMGPEGSVIAPFQWAHFVNGWLSNPFHAPMVCYEDLLHDTAGNLRRVLAALDLKPVKPIVEVVARQEFHTRRKDIMSWRTELPHGFTPQTKNLRLGQEGNWRHWFTRANAKRAHELWQSELSLLGYELNPQWADQVEFIPAGERTTLMALFLNGSDSINANRLRKVEALYHLAWAARDGAIVELGTYHGCGAISLYYGTRAGANLPVYTVDDYVPRHGWAGEPYGPNDQAIFYENLAAARARVQLVKGNVRQVPSEWTQPIALLFWDLGLRDSLRDDLELWIKHIRPGGVLAIQDTTFHDFGSDQLFERLLASNDWIEGRAWPFTRTLIKR